MADIRIKDLTTTASSTASGDFFVIDGTTGTRKVNAFNPSFGGNATVTGTLTANGLLTAAATTSLDGLPTAAIFGATKRIAIGYNTSGDYGFVASADSGTTWKELHLNPVGGIVKVPNTSASTTTSSGALVVGNGTSGGLGVGGAINAGGLILSSGSTAGLGAESRDGSGYRTTWYNPTGDDMQLDFAGIGTKFTITSAGNATFAGTLTANGATGTFGSSASSGTSLKVISGVGTLASPKYSTLDFRNYNDLKTGAYIRTGNRESDTNEWLLEIAARSNADVLTSVATFGAAGTTFASKVRWGNTGYPGYNAYLSEASTDSQLYPAIARNLVGSTGTGYTIANGELGAYCGFEFRVGDIRWFGATGTFTTGQTVTPVESMRLVSAGNLLIGTTTDNGQKLQVNGTAKVFSSSASTDTSSGALVVNGGVGVAGAIFAGGNIQCNAVYASNNTTLYLRPQGATVSSGEAQLTTAGNLTLAGTLTAGNFIKSVNTSAANDTEFTALRADVGADGTLGAAVVAIGSLPSATGASRYGFITCSDNTDWRKLYIGGRPGLAVSGGQVLIPCTTASTSTSSGALVVSGGVGVAGAIVAGSFIRSAGANNISLGADAGKNRIDAGGATDTPVRALGTADALTGIEMRLLGIIDGTSAPAATAGYAKLYVDSADGDLKVIFGDGTVKTIATDS